MDYSYFRAEKAVRLSDDDYYDFVMEKIRSASGRIHATLFIVDVFYDRWNRIKEMLDELAYAVWRGVDVKVVLGHSEKNLNVDIPDRLGFEYMKERGIPVRFSNPPDDYSLHSKYIVFDEDLVVAGSHNWSHLDIFMSKEDSAAVYSVDAVINLSNEFNKLWETGLEELV